MSFNSVGEVSDGARRGNPSSHLDEDFPRDTTKSGLPKRTLGDVFDKDRLRPRDLRYATASSHENPPPDKASKLLTDSYVPQHGADPEAWTKAGKTPNDMRRVAFINGRFGGLVQIAEPRAVEASVQGPSKPLAPERRRPTLMTDFRPLGTAAVKPNITPDMASEAQFPPFVGRATVPAVGRAVVPTTANIVFSTNPSGQITELSGSHLPR